MTLPQDTRIILYFHRKTRRKTRQMTAAQSVVSVLVR